ncbi:MAG: ferredoxin family protein [Balneolaceae bacterium]|nr:ferredoxin family protein [Balneolaceae bacterium]
MNQSYLHVAKTVKNACIDAARDGFREGPYFLTIDPIECIDCDACVSECPVEAIFPDDEVPEKWEHYIELNEKLAEDWKDRVTNESFDPLPDADEWANVEHKREHLIESWTDAD